MTLIKICVGVLLIGLMLVAVLGLLQIIFGLWDELKDYMRGRKNNE